MIQVIVVYEDNKDKELLDLVKSDTPIFIDYINYNSTSGRKEAYKVKSHWGAKANPFVELTEDNVVSKVFYSDAKGVNAIQQLINYLNNESKNKEIKS